MDDRQRTTERKSTRRDPRYDWNLDAAFPDYHIEHHAAAQDYRMAQADAVAQDAWSFRVLPRRSALHYLRLVGSILRLRGNVRGPDKTALHHGRVCELLTADSARHHIHEKMDCSAWRTKMANASPINLRQCDCRGGALRLARQTGCATTPYLRRRSCLSSHTAIPPVSASCRETMLNSAVRAVCTKKWSPGRMWRSVSPRVTAFHASRSLRLTLWSSVPPKTVIACSSGSSGICLY